MKPSREYSICFPTTLSNEENALKAMFEKLKFVRKAILASTRGKTNSVTSDSSKMKPKNAKRSIQEAEEATEEVKRKVMSGAINLKKANEKNTFKRSKVLEKRRESEKLKLDSSDNSSGGEILSPTSVMFGSPMFSGSVESYDVPKPNRGPTIYVRGYDLVEDCLQKAFEPFGTITRLFVEERHKSAFITFSSTDQAEAAIKEMDGNMVNGITLRVSFARRQNQMGPSSRGTCRGTSTSTSGGGSHVWGTKERITRDENRLNSPQQPQPLMRIVAPAVQTAWSQAALGNKSKCEFAVTSARKRSDSRSIVSYNDDLFTDPPSSSQQ
ncbi:hypothetical protein AB6A40_001773 [Gnathostoma spinigerum]|uniref:Negative elongation factor E n=1 Tax=Gnathostoma spinigerum TaxID=75299 RepID=A0ABD6ECM0_9BILA